MAMIVVGVDESEPAGAALQWAVAEGARRGWSVRAVLAWSYLDQRGNEDGDVFRPDYTADDAEAALDRLVDAIAPGADVERVAVNDLPARALLEASTGADLLVVGARGSSGLQGALLGSVSQQCVHHTTVPIAVVREAGDVVRDGPVVVGVDGSDNSVRALRWAIDAASARGTAVRVVSAARADGDVIADALASAGVGEGTATVERIHVDAAPARALIEAGADAALIVVGSRGRGGFARLLLGSVSRHVVNHATVPVVVVPPADRH